jgi:hypothetical protein
MARLHRHYYYGGESREQVSSIASGAMKYIAGAFLLIAALPLAYDEMIKFFKRHMGIG